jgi:prepilin-type N-terminal cleavage/methylation domain-containing protein
MRQGFSLLEMAVVIALAGLILLLVWPRLAGALDRLAVSRAAGEITTMLAIARHRAISQGTRARLVMREDSLVVDTLGDSGWGPWRSWPGPGARSVTLTVTNPIVAFSGQGLTWGFANTGVTLRRGSHSETITVSRLGRVKRW